METDQAPAENQAEQEPKFAQFIETRMSDDEKIETILADIAADADGESATEALGLADQYANLVIDTAEKLVINESREIGNDVQIGPFVVDQDDHSAQDFAQMLYSRFLAHRDTLKLGNSETHKRLNTMPEDETLRLIDYLETTFAPEHSTKFNIKIKGAYLPQNAFPMPQDPNTLKFHGTDASRATSILSEGFRVPEERKVDQHPMYGVGISVAPNVSKASPYFNEVGYSSRQRAEGVIFVIDPDLGKVHQTPSPMWGNEINVEGKKVNWRDTNIDTIQALSKDQGGNASASNFSEYTLKSPEQARIVAALWVELIPKNQPDYQPDNPVQYLK